MDELTAHRWGSDAPGQPWLRFEADGGLHGSDGCNRLSGRWILTGDRLEFGRLVSTTMFCRDVDTWLLGAASAHRESDAAGERLRIRNAAGEELGVLLRQDAGGGPRSAA